MTATSSRQHTVKAIASVALQRFGLNDNSCRPAETARASAISSMGGVTSIGNSAVSGTATAK